jgi:hypothetical protein
MRQSAACSRTREGRGNCLTATRWAWPSWPATGALPRRFSQMTRCARPAEGPGAARPPRPVFAEPLDQQPDQHQDRDKPRLTLAVPRTARRPADGPGYLTVLIRSIGIPTTAGRASAIRQQVLEMLSPVVADALGYHPVTTARLAAQAAATFSRYAPGDHARPSPARKPGKGKP